MLYRKSASNILNYSKSLIEYAEHLSYSFVNIFSLVPEKSWQDHSADYFFTCHLLFKPLSHVDCNCSDS